MFCVSQALKKGKFNLILGKAMKFGEAENVGY